MNSNPFAALLGSVVRIDEDRWSLEDAHDTRCCLKSHDGKQRWTTTPNHLCTLFTLGRAQWYTLTLNPAVAQYPAGAPERCPYCDFVPNAQALCACDEKG